MKLVDLSYNGGWSLLQEISMSASFGNFLHVLKLGVLVLICGLLMAINTKIKMHNRYHQDQILQKTATIHKGIGDE